MDSITSHMMDMIVAHFSQLAALITTRQLGRMLQATALMCCLAAMFGLARPAQATTISSSWTNNGAIAYCLDAGADSPGTQSHIFPCNDTFDQKWQLNGAQIIAPGSNGSNGNYCLDVKGANMTAGTPVQVWPCNGGKNQAWAFYAGEIFNPYYTSLCLDLDSNNQLIVNNCGTGVTTQTWILR